MKLGMSAWKALELRVGASQRMISRHTGVCPSSGPRQPRVSTSTRLDAIDRIGDQDLAGMGPLRQPGGSVGRLAGDRVGAVPIPAATAGRFLASGDADMDVQVGAWAMTTLRQTSQNIGGCPQRAIAVIVMGPRCAEDGHDVVADLLVDHPAIALDDGLDRIQTTFEQPMRARRPVRRGR